MDRNEFKNEIKNLIEKDLKGVKLGVVVELENLNNYLGGINPRAQKFWAGKTVNNGVIVIPDSSTMEIYFSLEEFLEDIMGDFYAEWLF